MRCPLRSQKSTRPLRFDGFESSNPVELEVSRVCPAPPHFQLGIHRIRASYHVTRTCDHPQLMRPIPPYHLVLVPVSGWIEPLCGFAEATTSPATAGSGIGRPCFLHRIGSVLGPFSMTTFDHIHRRRRLSTPPNHYTCIRRLPLQTAKAVYKSSVD